MRSKFISLLFYYMNLPNQINGLKLSFMIHCFLRLSPGRILHSYRILSCTLERTTFLANKFNFGFTLSQ
jgi:hypothetical protein